MPPQSEGNPTPPTPSASPQGIPQQVPLQNAPPVVPQPQTDIVSDDTQYSQPGWSWGGFILGPFFLIGIRHYKYLWLYLLMFVPIVNFIAHLGIMIFLGLKGREMAAISTTFHNKEQYIGFMRAVDHAGKIMFFVMLVIIGLWLAFMALFFGAMFSGGDFSM